MPITVNAIDAFSFHRSFMPLGWDAYSAMKQLHGSYDANYFSKSIITNAERIQQEKDVIAYLNTKPGINNIKESVKNI